MCGRPRLPALTGASLCWGGLRKTWGRVYADELQPPQDPQGVFRGKLGHIHARWVGPGLGRPLWDPQALQEAVQEARAHPRADLCLLPGSSCGLLASETSD